MKKIDRLSQLHEAATPGPWTVDAGPTSAYVVGQVARGRPGGEVIIVCRPTVANLPVDNEANAELIAAVRNALPELLVVAELARQWANCEPDSLPDRLARRRMRDLVGLP